MSISLYLVPIIGDGKTPLTGFRPKYFGDGTISLSVPWTCKHYPAESLVLVGSNTSVIENTTLVSKLDVTVLVPLISPQDYSIETICQSVGINDLSTAANVKAEMIAIAKIVVPTGL